MAPRNHYLHQQNHQQSGESFTTSRPGKKKVLKSLNKILQKIYKLLFFFNFQVQKKTMYHLPKSRHLFSYQCPLHLPPRHLATMDILYPLWEVGQGLMGQDPHLDPLGVNAMPQFEVNQCLLLILTGFTGHRLCQDSGLLRPLVAKETMVITETFEWWRYNF